MAEVDVPASGTAPAAPSIPNINPWIIAIAVMFGTFMEVLDTTVVNVSLPHIAGNLSATVDEAAWTLTSYLVANAIVLPITGWLAQFFGRKRLLMMSLTGFTIASLLSGLAPTLGALVFFRIIQGATGGVLQPISQSVMLEAFPPQDRGKAMAFWGLGIVVAPMLGPILGGWLTDSYSWRWVFYINLPVGIASLYMTKRFIFDPPYLQRGARSVDGWGIGMLALGIAALQIMLDKGQQDDWFGSPFIVGCATVAIGMLIAFIIRELVAREPVVHLKVFKSRNYSVGVLMMTTLGFVLYGSLVALPVFLQTLMHYPAVEAGLATAPRGLGAFIGMPIIGAVMSRGIDPRKLLAAGFFVAGLTLVQLSMLDTTATIWNFFWPQLWLGLALSFMFVPLTTTTMDPIPKEEMGNATSLFNLMRNLGGGFGIAAATTIIARDSQRNFSLIGEHVTAYNPLASQRMTDMTRGFAASGMDPSSASHAAYAAMAGAVHQQAALLSYLHAFRVFGVIFIVVVPLLFLLKRPSTTRRPAAAH
jgi:DHA2 family multidrug resistance protein